MELTEEPRPRPVARLADCGQVLAADFDRNLARQFEQIAVEQEEAGQACGLVMRCSSSWRRDSAAGQLGSG